MEELQILGFMPDLCLLYTEGTDPLREEKTLYMTFKAAAAPDSPEATPIDWFLCFDQKKKEITRAGLHYPELYFPEHERGLIKRWSLQGTQFKNSIIEEILKAELHGCLLYNEGHIIIQNKLTLIKGNIIYFFYHVGGKKNYYYFKPRTT